MRLNLLGFHLSFNIYRRNHRHLWAVTEACIVCDEVRTHGHEWKLEASEHIHRGISYYIYSCTVPGCYEVKTDVRVAPEEAQEYGPSRTEERYPMQSPLEDDPTFRKLTDENVKDTVKTNMGERIWKRPL